MKPEQLAKSLGISSSTLRYWAGRDFPAFLSPSAQGRDGAKRSFDERDARIIAWIATLKAQNLTNGEITAILESEQAKGWPNLPGLPPGPAEQLELIPREAVEARLSALKEQSELRIQTVEKERDGLAKERDDLLTRIEKLQADLDAARSEINTLQRQHIEELLELNKQLVSLLNDKIKGK